jgi:hypothetical protein
MLSLIQEVQGDETSCNNRERRGRLLCACPARCLSQGKTYDEAIGNIKEAIAGWLEVMEDKQTLDPSRLVEVAV